MRRGKTSKLPNENFVADPHQQTALNDVRDRLIGHLRGSGDRRLRDRSDPSAKSWRWPPLAPSCRSHFGEVGLVSKVHPPSDVVRIKPAKRGVRNQGN